MTEISQFLIKTIIKDRKADSHKGTYGHALLIAGNTGKMGAALIAAKACLRSGVGLVTVNIPFVEHLTLQVFVPEAMVNFRENSISDYASFSAIGIGPGIGQHRYEKKVLKEFMGINDKQLILDADALNILSNNKKLLAKIPVNTILTPHPKEFDRLFGIHKSNEERIAKAVKTAHELNIVIVLKGHQTFVTDGTNNFFNSTGNSGLAKGGSGDALTGLITGFLAQQYSSINTALAAVYLHGLAADITLENQTMETMIITDVIENFGAAFKKLRN